MKLTAEQAFAVSDIAVDLWHRIADEHGHDHCNCFRDALMRRLIIDRRIEDPERLSAAFEAARQRDVARFH